MFDGSNMKVEHPHSVECIADGLFLFNKKLSDIQKKEIETAIEVIDCLYLTPFNAIFVEAKTADTLKYVCRLYEDPEIRLLSPLEIADTAKTVLAYSAGIIEQSHLSYDVDKGFFIEEDLLSILDTFTGYDSLLFLAINNV